MLVFSKLNCPRLDGVIEQWAYMLERSPTTSEEDLPSAEGGEEVPRIPKPPPARVSTIGYPLPTASSRVPSLRRTESTVSLESSIDDAEEVEVSSDEDEDDDDSEDDGTVVPDFEN